MILEIPAHIYSNTQRPIFEMFLDGPFVTPLDREIGVLELDRKGADPKGSCREKWKNHEVGDLPGGLNIVRHVIPIFAA
jgi:hypothetical protein